MIQDNIPHPGAAEDSERYNITEIMYFLMFTKRFE
jgi:hypothetical protein